MRALAGPRPCAHCGRDFRPVEKLVRRGDGRFCSLPCKYEGTKKPLVERYWSKVEKTATCWLWTGALISGYGSITDGAGKREAAHHLAWIWRHGPIPTGFSVCHNCPDGDNPRCVNPDHLFLGTHRDNMLDMWAKGRARPVAPHRGEANRSAKLTDDSVREIRRRYAAGGLSYAALGREFGTTTANVRFVALRLSWKHVM